jgi:hypothetical protein
MVHSSALFKIKQQNCSGKKDLIDYYVEVVPIAEQGKNDCRQ